MGGAAARRATVGVAVVTNASVENATAGVELPPPPA